MIKKATHLHARPFPSQGHLQREQHHQVCLSGSAAAAAMAVVVARESVEAGHMGPAAARMDAAAAAR